MEHLRPFERRVLAMRAAGTPIPEIALAFRRSVPHIERVITWSDIPRSGPAPRRKGQALERRVLSLRSAGLGYDEIAPLFRASPGFIRRIEGLAHFRKARELLT
jgi:hypothetical protein